MTDEKLTPQNEQANLDNSTLKPEEDDKPRLLVEGQNENITSPPPDIAAEHAAVARATLDLTMAIEDDS